MPQAYAPARPDRFAAAKLRRVVIFKMLRKAIDLRMPLAVQLRLLVFIVNYVTREFAWVFAAAGAVVIAALVLAGGLETTLGVVALALVALAELLMLWLTWRAFGSARAVRESLAELEAGGSPFPSSHLWFPPLMLFAGSVRHQRGVVFAERGRLRLRLDVYEPRGEPPADGLRPAVIQVHGGGWIVGTRMEQGIPLLNHLAAHGWVGFNIDYRLSPRATFPEHLIDVKEAIAWVREHAQEYSIDPSRVCLTGGSAGGHLTALAALTANDPAYQPGFEDADTSVAAAVPFYGIYDFTNSENHYWPELRSAILEPFVIKASFDEEPERFRSASPVFQVHTDAPPFLVVHGERDTLVPVDDARRFVAELRAVSSSPVLYAELAGAEHAFDLLPSVRTARIVEAIERFLDTQVRPRELADSVQ